MDEGYIGERLGRIEQKIDDLHEDHRELGKKMDIFDTRVGALERWRSWLTGIYTAVGGGIGWLLRGEWV